MKKESFNAPYRAKTKEKGKESVWIYGFYVRLHDGKGNVSHRIYPGNAESDCGDFYPDWFEIDPDTLCRYSELPDKNGKKIFEGDIVRYNTFDGFDCHSVVMFGKYKQDGSGGEYAPKDCSGWYVDVDNFNCPDWAENDPTYFNSYLIQQNLSEVAATCEVIGNIHDNSELLEEVGNG